MPAILILTKRLNHRSRVITDAFKASRAQMRSICLRLAKCRHDTLIQIKRKQQIAIFLQLHVTIRVTSAIFLIRSRRFFFMKPRDCSKILVFFEIGAFIIAFKRNINSLIFPTEKCREKYGVFRHLDALIWPTLSKRFAFALYQPWMPFFISHMIFSRSPGVFCDLIGDEQNAR